MKQSKVIFGVIAAIVAIAVIVVIAFSSGSKPETPTTDGEHETPSTNSPSMDVPSTGSDDTTEPSASEPSGSFPIWEFLYPYYTTDGTEPTEPENPEYEKFDLPASSGMNYNNDESVSITIDYEHFGLKELKICFGTGVSGTKQYIALNPTVEVLSSKGGKIAESYQFYFMPSDGYVTTITDGEYGSYIKKTENSTFRRALDYALPSAYVSDELPGTIWYMGAGERAAASYIEVLVYNFGELVASLHINIAKDRSGNYYLESIGNKNQLDDDCFDERIPQERIEALLMYSEDFMREEYRANVNFTEDYFLIERRAIGQSTYFDYVNILPYGNSYGSTKADYLDVELYAVTFRALDRGSYYRPVTLYYIFSVEDGIDNYAMVGIDNPDTYNLDTLIYARWPDYIDNPEDSWFINPPIF